MMTLKMDDRKHLVCEDEPLLFCGERSADRIAIYAPRYYEEQDLSLCEMRICISQSGRGEYAILAPTLIEEGLMRVEYTLAPAFTARAGVHMLWLEFWSLGEETHRLLYSEMLPITVLAHDHAQNLFGEAELSYLAQYHAAMEAHKQDSAAYLTQMEALCDAAAQSVAEAQRAKEETEAALDGYVKHGVDNIRMHETLRLQSVAGGLAIQPYPIGGAGNNVISQELTFTFGYKNQNGGWAAFAGGLSNRTTQSQQFVMGSGNTLPASKNMAAVGQYCRSTLEDSTGKLLTDTSAASRPLFAVGNGSSTSNRANAFTVYGDGEAVLEYAGERIPLAKTAREHSDALAALQACYAEIVLQQEYKHCLGIDADALRGEGSLPSANRKKPTTGVELTEARLTERLRAYLLAWQSDATTPLYLDRSYTDVARVAPLGSGWALWFAGANLSVFVELYAGASLEETHSVRAILSAGNLLCEESGCTVHGDCLRGMIRLLHEVENTVENGTGSKTSLLSYDTVTYSFADAIAAAHAAGRRVRALTLTYVPYPALGKGYTLTFPYDSKNTMGSLTLTIPSLPECALRQGTGVCELTVAPAAFGAEHWFVQTPDGEGVIYYVLELS